MFRRLRSLFTVITSVIRYITIFFFAVLELPNVLLLPSALLLPSIGGAQSTATLRGRVVDSSGAVVSGVNLTVSHRETGVDRLAQTDNEGSYQIAVLPIGTYRIAAQAAGFQTQIVENVIIEVGRTV